MTSFESWSGNYRGTKSSQQMVLPRKSPNDALPLPKQQVFKSNLQLVHSYLEHYKLNPKHKEALAAKHWHTVHSRIGKWLLIRQNTVAKAIVNFRGGL